MAKRPMRFNNTRAAFDEAAQMRLCESSGSEHYSPDNSADLSELVNSFIERDYRIQGDNAKDHDLEYDSKLEQLENSRRDTLACGIVGERSSHGFKRRLMSRLREQGFDAGLCKSRWEKFGRHPPGEYEYVDVNIDGNRFVVEVFLAGEFEIARPTTGYAALLDAFPLVFIGKPEELKQVVRLMCSAIRRSMKEMDLHVPPWRRNGYIQAKWFGPYKRTINEIPVSKRLEPSDSFAAKRSVGFEAYPVKAYHCSDDFARDKMGFKVGYLTAAFNGSG
ncbi:hypothetical protein GH714_020816 [Hevea brasiliensis]|uniref:DUF506 family protein n=1 Tax=Hevea brasiliensis TaxID=3981 RepID=A0A6A6LA06_HEVBR|nr:hypothetical protein GH714_020816 [Hevea brasiliensis]